MTKRGVIYCATNSAVYLEAALLSAIALRQHEPKIPITLVSDQTQLQHLPLQDYGITPRLIATNELVHPFASRCIKTQLHVFNPYQEALYIDADILPLQSLDGLWNLLSQTDLAMALDRLPALSLCDHIAEVEKEFTLQQLSGDTVQFNSGLILWRDTPAMHRLFQAWYEEWQKFQKHDQLALLRAVRTTQTAITPIPKTYNISPIDAAPLIAEGQTIHMLHCWGGKVAEGQFRQIVQQYYPRVFETVTQLLGSVRKTPEVAIR